MENSELVLIGNIDKDLNKKLIKFKKNKNIIFKKSMKQGELKNFYNVSDVFVLNSIEDGFGMVIPQAMACGLPVITTKNTGGSEIIDNDKDGFVIPIRSKKILKEKITFLYNNPSKCLKMGTIAKDKITSKYSWDAYGKRQIDMYLSLIKKSKI